MSGKSRYIFKFHGMNKNIGGLPLFSKQASRHSRQKQNLMFPRSSRWDCTSGRISLSPVKSGRRQSSTLGLPGDDSLDLLSNGSNEGTHFHAAAGTDVGNLHVRQHDAGERRLQELKFGRNARHALLERRKILDEVL